MYVYIYIVYKHINITCTHINIYISYHACIFIYKMFINILGVYIYMTYVICLSIGMLIMYSI